MEFNPEQIHVILEMLKLATAIDRGSAYGDDRHESFCIPPGYELTGEIRPVNHKDKEIGLFYHVYEKRMIVTDPIRDKNLGAPMIILRKIKKYEWITDGIKRIPVYGDWIDFGTRGMTEITNKWFSGDPQLCYRRIEVE